MIIYWDEDGFWSEAESLLQSGLGKKKGSKIVLEPEEVVFLAEMGRAKVMKDEREIPLSSLLSALRSRLASFFVFRDWRRRGLFARKDVPMPGGEQKTVVYTESPLNLPDVHLSAVFFPEALIAISDDQAGKELFENYWLGQYGTYKAHGEGRFAKFDVFETLYLMEKGILQLDVSREEVLKAARERFPFFDALYHTFRTWRSAGYVVKTGFKFGTHFRIYFPGAKPDMPKRAHSRHLLHVFPEGSRMLVSEWARVIRVAHSVRKTFLLGVPKQAKFIDPDWFLYYRDKKGRAQSFVDSLPRFACFAFSEDEWLGAEHFSSVLESALKLGCQPLIAVVDRESSVTYYWVRKISLSSAKEMYCEIEWFQP